MTGASWIVRNKETGEVLFETFDKRKVDALNVAKYEAVPIDKYLASLNWPYALCMDASIDDE